MPNKHLLSSTDAATACQEQKDAHLAFVTDHLEQEAIGRLLQQTNGQYAFWCLHRHSKDVLMEVASNTSLEIRNFEGRNNATVDIMQKSILSFLFTQEYNVIAIEAARRRPI